MHFYSLEAVSAESQSQVLWRWVIRGEGVSSIRVTVAHLTRRKRPALKTSVGFHSGGVIPASSMDNTSTLPAGSPSGGDRVSAVADVSETDVHLGNGDEELGRLAVDNDKVRRTRTQTNS